MYFNLIWQYYKYGNITTVGCRCSRHPRSNTNVPCCYYTDTCRQLFALKRAGCNKPLMWTWSACCVGNPLDARRSSFGVAECDAACPLAEPLVDLAFTCCECRWDCVWSLLTGAYLYSGSERGRARLASQ
jgi:hypothetical protein